MPYPAFRMVNAGPGDGEPSLEWGTHPPPTTWWCEQALIVGIYRHAAAQANRAISISTGLVANRCKPSLLRIRFALHPHPFGLHLRVTVAQRPCLIEES